MNQLIYQIPDALAHAGDVKLITILSTRGSTPQVPGSSLILSEGRLLAGTLGGGVLEGFAIQKAEVASGKEDSEVFSFELNAPMDDPAGAICGGSAELLLDADPFRSRDVFMQMHESLSRGRAGVLLTRILGPGPASIERAWFEVGEEPASAWSSFREEIRRQSARGESRYMSLSSEERLFIHPVSPLEELIIAGAGHIGKALCHQAKLLGFRVVVIDPREAYANQESLPDADRILCEPVEEAVKKLSFSRRTYVLIATRNHQEDAAALRSFLTRDPDYIGMLGSRRKIQLMRQQFIQQDWATSDQFDGVYAPVGLELGGRTVQEIVVSIAAQLVQVRNQQGYKREVRAVILAAGESARMGQPKMLLPFGEGNMIQQVVEASCRSMNAGTTVVLGANAGPIADTLQTFSVQLVKNKEYKKGMLSSVQCGLKHLPGKADAMMVLLGDQPLVDAGTINRLLRAYRRSARDILIATYQGRRGHPVLISRKYFDEILALAPEKSLRDLLSRHAGDIDEVESGQPGVLIDIDTKEEYQEEIHKLKQRI